MSHTELALGDLRPNPHNLRGVYQRVEELAESIRQYGLLQNLVVREMEDHFQVVAGNRRYHALKHLASKGKWSRLVPVLVIDGKGDFEAIAEGVTQEPLYTWRLGLKYLNLIEAGYTQNEIAARASKTQGHVSIAVQIARGLAPSVCIRCERLGPGYVANNQLLRMAKLYDHELGEPLEREQLELLDQILSGQHVRRQRRKKTGTAAEERETVWRRYRRLRDGRYAHLPQHAASTIRTVVRYLGGVDNRLKFQ